MCALATAVCFAERSAANRYAAFDEREEETERCRMAQATPPLLSTGEKGAYRVARWPQQPQLF
jgi:hypothetical protein